MHNFFRKNSKKLLAVMGIFLMVSFAATARTPSAGQRTAVAIGSFGSTKIFNSDVDTARQDLRILLQSLVVQPNGTGDWQPMLSATQPIIAAMLQDPKLFVLLQKEAEQMGIVVGDEPIDEQMSRLFRVNIAVQVPDGPVRPLHALAETGQEDLAQAVQAAGRRFFSVLLASNQAVDMMKISAPLREYYLAQDHQQLQVRTVVFAARNELSHVPKPTTQQLQEQFNRFADVPSTGSSSSVSPFGVGYQIPEQYKLETLSIPHATVVAAVKKSKSDYDWDVAAHYYYDKHLADFPATQPTASSLPSMVAAPTTAVASTNASTTKPFEVVQADVMAAVMKPQIDALADKAQHEIAATLAADATTYHAPPDPTITEQTHAGTAPTNSPTYVRTERPRAIPDSSTQISSTHDATTQSTATSLNTGFDTLEYFPALAAKIQQDTGILPVVEQLNKPISIDEAAALPGIGSSHSADGMLAFREALSDPMLTPFQPSVSLTDDAGSIYFFRVRQRIAAHRPASMDAIASTVLADWQLSQAFDLARAAADKLSTAARTDGLIAAAHAANLEIDYPPAFALSGRAGREPIKGVPLSGDALEHFRQRCQSLLTAAAQHQPPVTTIESPLDAKILVAELSGVVPDWHAGQRQQIESEVSLELRNEFSRPLQSEWFTLADVEKRLGYKDLDKNKS